MRKRIQKLAMAKFEYEEHQFLLSTDKIEIEVTEGQSYKGDFTVSSANHKKLKGLVYSSNPHMECLTPQFEGEEVRIQFEFHSEGFIEGDIQKGEFYIICNHGEYNLSFVVSVCKLYAKTSVGKIRNVADFVKLAQYDYMEAYRLFSSPAFANILKEDRPKLLYEGLSKLPCTPENMEEFLIALNKKTAITVKLSQEECVYQDIGDMQKEILHIEKDQWGYVSMDVYHDGEFLTVTRARITSQDFIGSTAELEYYIDPDKLHAGRNLGRIRLENMYQSLTYQVVVWGKKIDEESTLLEEQRALVELTQHYMDYRLKKITNAMWASKTTGILDHLLAMCGENQWYSLMKAQTLLVSSRRQEAEWILKEYRNHVEDKESEAYAYYLYLCTLYEREPSYVNRLTKEVTELYHKHDESHFIFWILLFMSEEYCNNDLRKIRAIEQRVLDGCRSPFLYMEAYYLFWQNPYLLTKLDTFEIRILYWAVRQNTLARDMTLQIMNLAGGKRVFEPILYRVLCKAYDLYEQKEMAATICTYLIRGQRFGRAYHKWYALGVEEDMRIAGLNEAYLMSMDAGKVTQIPQVVQMYFQYNSAIPYKQKAALLVNIIANQEKYPRVYGNYRRIMEDFALEQVLEGHMDDNLAVVYAEVLDRGMIHKEMVHPLARILYTHKITFFTDNIRKVYVLHTELRSPQEAQVVRGVAYVQLYSPKYVIVLEDQNGKRYVQGVSYQLERLMNPGQYLRTCLEYAPHELSFLLQHFAQRSVSSTFIQEDREYLNQLLRQDGLRESYRARLLPEVLGFYDRIGEEEYIRYYLDTVRMDWMSRVGRGYVIGQMIEYHMFEEAYQCIMRCGTGEIGTAKLVPLCSYLIEQNDYEEDEFLIELSTMVFLNGKYNDVILRFLCSYFGGTTKHMAKLWKAAQSFELDTYALEERLITQMLYTTEFVDNVADIYESYYNHGGNELVEAAYIYYFAYHYFVKLELVPNQIFEELEAWMHEKKPIADAGKLALLRHFSELDSLSEMQQSYVRCLLDELVGRGIYFSFYKQFNNTLAYEYQLHDKMFVEYRTNPRKRVVLHYRIEPEMDSYDSVDMTDMYEGIFVKELILFFGETIDYYITEEDGSQIETTESNQIRNHSICGDSSESRFDMLNAMIYEQTIGDDEAKARLMLQYDRHQSLNELLFHLI